MVYRGVVKLGHSVPVPHSPCATIVQSKCEHTHTIPAAYVMYRPALVRNAYTSKTRVANDHSHPPNLLPKSLKNECLGKARHLQ